MSAWGSKTIRAWQSLLPVAPPYDHRLAPQTNTTFFYTLLSSLVCIRETSRSVTHSKIALGQARLTPEFFVVGLPEKKVYLGGMSILSMSKPPQNEGLIDKDRLKRFLAKRDTINAHKYTIPYIKFK
jgi:hypothetical protein